MDPEEQVKDLRYYEDRLSRLGQSNENIGERKRRSFDKDTLDIPIFKKWTWNTDIEGIKQNIVSLKKIFC